MKIVLFSAASLLTLAVAVNAQFTPGSGGTFIRPSTPVVPGPAQPQGPIGPTPPTYTWETPAQAQPAQPIVAPQPVAAPGDAVRIVAPQQAYVPQLSDAQLADLTASIALYPDPLLAVMFPAATYAEELTFADRWQEQHPGADERTIQGLPLEDSVKAVMHYPGVLDLMINHLDWTQSVGIAFVYQRQDLFESVQRWRSTAVSNGYLFSTPQQDVLQQGAVILIQPPAQTQVVYVPVYDPAVVYVRPLPSRPAPRNVITFAGNGLSLSFALNDVDWRDHEVRIPRHDDVVTRGGIGDRGGIVVGGSVTPGRGPAPDAKTVFVPGNIKPNLVYPQKVLTPQPDKKVITLPPPGATPFNPGRGPGGPAGIGPGGAGNPGRGPGGNPNTPF